MCLAKIRAITDCLRELSLSFFGFPFCRQLNSELETSLPKFRFGFDDRAQAGNYFIPPI